MRAQIGELRRRLAALQPGCLRSEDFERAQDELRALAMDTLALQPQAQDLSRHFLPALPRTKTLRVAMLVFDGYEILDAWGPLEVFGILSWYTREMRNQGVVLDSGRPFDLPEDVLLPTSTRRLRQVFQGNEEEPENPYFTRGVEVEVVNIDRSRPAGWPEARVETTLAALPTLAQRNVASSVPEQEGYDLVLVPGGSGTRRLVRDRAFVEDLGKLLAPALASPSTKLLATVCTGSALAGVAGALDGRRATSHAGAWAHVTEATAGRPIQWVPGARWVTDGNVVSSGGVSAGTDMALFLVQQLFGPAARREVVAHMIYSDNFRHRCRGTEMDWQPEGTLAA